MNLQKWDLGGGLDREVSIYEHMVKSGARVAFVTYGDAGERRYENRLPGVEIIPFYESHKQWPGRLGALLQSFIPWTSIAKQVSKYQVYKTNQLWGAWVPLLLRLRTKSPVIVRCGYEYYLDAVRMKKSLPKRVFIFCISWIAYRGANHILVTTHEMAKYITDTFGADPNKISVIPNFIDTELFKPQSGPKNGRMIFVGRLSKEKNVAALIEAANKAQIGLDLVGEGKLLPDLRELASKLNADVRFLGRVANQELASRLSQYSIFALPSFYEGNPKALLEAMSCGIAVVGTDVPGIREVIQSGKTGFLCGTRSGEIAAAISRIKNDFALCDALGRQAREFILGYCALSAVLKAETAIYQKLILSYSKGQNK
jgi:glycosyltransferase involved in cell wall biosynthesis